MAWFLINDAILDDPAILRQSAKVLFEKLRAAMRGEENEFSRHLRRTRLSVTSNEWVALRAEVFERDDYTCSYCGRRGGRLECDHVIPVSRGGTDALSNLTTACRDCNQDKRAKTLEEWLGAEGAYA